MPRATATTQPGAVPKRLMSLAEFLSNYSVSRSEFYRLCAKGAAPAICKIGRKTLVPFDAAEEWLQARIRPASELCRAAAAAALIVVGLAIAAQPVKAQMFDPSAPQQVILPQADTVQAAQ
jgi:predicted DNA-binding transcriptional regulator AlpA